MDRQDFTEAGLDCYTEIVRYARGPWRIHGRVRLPEGVTLPQEAIDTLGWDTQRGSDVLIAFNHWVKRDKANAEVRRAARELADTPSVAVAVIRASAVSLDSRHPANRCSSCEAGDPAAYDARQDVTVLENGNRFCMACEAEWTPEELA